MAAKFELYKDKRGEFRWRLRHQNGQIIADSGEGYTKKAGALNGIESVKKNCREASITELEARESTEAVREAKAPPVPAKVTEPEAPPAPAKTTEAKAPPAPARVIEAKEERLAEEEIGKGQAILTKLLIAMVILLVIFGILMGTNVGPLSVWIWVESVLGVITVGTGLGLAIYRLWW